MSLSTLVLLNMEPNERQFNCNKWKSFRCFLTPVSTTANGTHTQPNIGSLDAYFLPSATEAAAPLALARMAGERGDVGDGDIKSSCMVYLIFIENFI